MAIPYYSMDLNGREVRSIFFKMLFFQAFKGPLIEQYTQKVQQTLGRKFVVPTPSGRTAFYFLIDCLFKKDDEVIVSAFSFPLFAKMLIDKGVKVVFVDVKSNGLINEDLIEAKITPKTKGILITHLFGNACAMDEITAICQKYHLSLIEDCAHAFGSTFKGKPLGTFGHAIFSTSPMKIPMTLGGGLLVTDDEKVSYHVSQALQRSPDYHYSVNKVCKLFTFTLIYYLNSFPWLFSVLTSRIFQYLNVKNPGKLRELFYSDANFSKPFNPFERIKFSNLQARVGLFQVNRNEQMIEKRRMFSRIYDAHFAQSKNVKPVPEPEHCRNNFLYHIVDVSGNVDQLLDESLKRGLFLMREDGWYCLKYAFAKDYQKDCPVAEGLFPRLVRLPNSSLLKERKIHEASQIFSAVIS